MDKWNNCCSIEKKSLSFPGIRHIRQLIWGNIQLFCKDLSVTHRLVQHQDKLTVLKDIFNVPAGKKIFDILCDTSRYTSPFSESLPDFYGISYCLFFFEQKVEFIDIVPGRFDATVDCNSVLYLILDDEHSDFLQLFSKFLDVKADNTVIQLHIGPMIEYFQ